MPLFKDTPEKAAVREHDLPLIVAFSREKGRRLRYLGLPGPEMLDVLLWGEYLSDIVAVEDERVSGTISETELVLTAFRNNLVGQLTLLSGDIDSLLTLGVDKNGMQAEYPFDIVNLDYQGGVIHRRQTGTARRVDAIKDLIRRQADSRSDFLLLMTFSCRNDDQNEIAEVLDDILRMESDRVENLDEYMAHLRDARMDWRLKVYVPHMIRLACMTFGYDPAFFSVITYLGGSGHVRLVHFAVRMKWIRRAAGAPPTQSMLEVLTLPMMEVQEGNIIPCSYNIPVSITRLHEAVPEVEPSSELLVALFSRQFEYEVMQYLRRQYQYTEIRPHYRPEFLHGREADVYARKRSDFVDDITICECKLRFNESKMIGVDEIRRFSSLLKLARDYEEERAQAEGKTVRVRGWHVSNAAAATDAAVKQAHEDGIEIWRGELAQNWQVQGDCTISRMTRLSR